VAWAFAEECASVEFLRGGGLKRTVVMGWRFSGPIGGGPLGEFFWAGVGLGRESWVGTAWGLVGLERDGRVVCSHGSWASQVQGVATRAVREGKSTPHCAVPYRATSRAPRLIAVLPNDNNAQQSHVKFSCCPCPICTLCFFSSHTCTLSTTNPTTPSPFYFFSLRSRLRWSPCSRRSRSGRLFSPIGRLIRGREPSRENGI